MPVPRSAVSIKDVARSAGVSPSTVSNVLNRPERVSARTRLRVEDAVSELGFVRNDAARQLRAGQSQSLGLGFIEATNPFFTSLARAAEDVADASGRAVLVASSANDPTREARAISMFEEHRVAALLISPLTDALSHLRKINERGTPVVLVDRLASDADFSSVSVDDVEGGRLAAEHLLERGRRRVTFVGGPIGLRQVTDRYEGAAIAVAARSDATSDVVSTLDLTVAEGRLAGDRILSRPTALRPDAVFAANDLVALGLLHAFVMTGTVRVPEDIALVGYDDIDFAQSANRSVDKRSAADGRARTGGGQSGRRCRRRAPTGTHRAGTASRAARVDDEPGRDGNPAAQFLML